MAMKFRFGNLTLRLGSAPVEENNFFSIERRGATTVLRAAIFAENFDPSLTFYVEVSEGACKAAENCWFELQRRSRKRLPHETFKGVCIAGYTQSGALYGHVGSEVVSTLLNEVWLNGPFRIIGTVQMNADSAVELANSIINRDLHEALTLPEKVTFVLERQYLRGEPFLVVVFQNDALTSIREIISGAATRLHRPLLETGMEGWPDWDRPV
ncbi:MAG TPA: hypothetical protein VGJ33_10795 [Candidatus Angelobacter sp.]